MEDYLIVDGYNIIGAWPELRRLKEIDLEQARVRLTEILADYQAYSGMKTHVVFDAYKVPGQGKRLEEKRLVIWYTKEAETADERIERLVAELSRRGRRIYVATSDMTEQNVAFGKGALRISARELLLDIEESRREVNAKIRETREDSGNSFDSKLSKELKNLFEKWRRGE